MPQQQVVVALQNAKVDSRVNVRKSRALQITSLTGVMQLFLGGQQAVLNAVQRGASAKVAEDQGAKQILNVVFLCVDLTPVGDDDFFVGQIYQGFTRQHIAQLREYRGSLRLHGEGALNFGGWYPKIISTSPFF